MVLGMLFGSDGIVGIPFDDYAIAEQLCTVGLIFIMFYGGFGTNWRVAKPVLGRSILMSTLGVVLTAGILGVLCTLFLKTSLLEGLLLGAIVGSTDAASVFSILRSKKLNLKDGLASLLEIESGSNDPCAYMLTITILTLLSGSGAESVIQIVVCQIVFGLGVGAFISFVAMNILKRVSFEIEGLHSIFVVAIALLGYALADFFGGNGFLSVYIIGIVLGNSKIVHKRSLVNFFDGISWLMQIMLFFILGLLSFPSHLPAVLLDGTVISLLLILIARPVATFAILGWFRMPLKQLLFVSWTGLRGAASIVFAIFSVTRTGGMGNDLFHIVFYIALFSVSVQGTLVPFLAKKLGLVDDSKPVMKTFTDYYEDTGTQLLEHVLSPTDPWCGKSIIQADIPEEILIVMIKRGDEIVIPKGSTTLKQDDILVLSGNDIGRLVEPYTNSQTEKND